MFHDPLFFRARKYYMLLKELRVTMKYYILLLMKKQEFLAAKVV